jgi:hypothetical protein
MNSKKTKKINKDNAEYGKGTNKHTEIQEKVKLKFKK